MIRILVVNTGSSSLKLQILAGTEVTAERSLERWDGSVDPAPIVALLEEATEPVDAVGHRVVHGGRDLTIATVLDDEVEEKIDALTPLAPLHQPRALAGIRAARTALPSVPHVACFDTSFHHTIGPAARTYALPSAWRQRWDLGRYGFHGLSHAWVAQQAPRIAPGRPTDRIVSCHLGAGASLCAIRDGASVDTTMGFTPMEGLVMATRSGSVDPGLLLWLQTDVGLGADEVAEGLTRHAGLAGLSGTDGDVRDVLEASGSGDADAGLALEVYVHRLRREIGAMAAALGGLDVLAFTGGVGEHSPWVREAAVAGLAFLGLSVDPAANEAVSGDADISRLGDAARTLVVVAREDLQIARQVREALG